MVAEPFTMDLERGKIREFASATGSTNPDHLEGENPTIPPAFLMASAFWMGPENIDLELPAGDLSRLLHGGQEFIFHGPPPRAGTRLTGQARPGKTWQKEGRRGGTMNFSESIVEFRDPDGRLVAESRGTLIITSDAPPKE